MPDAAPFCPSQIEPAETQKESMSLSLQSHSHPKAWVDGVHELGVSPVNQLKFLLYPVIESQSCQSKQTGRNQHKKKSGDIRHRETIPRVAMGILVLVQG